MGLIGIIANPASGKDIRRIVSGARVVPHQEKANIINRFLAGVAATGRHKLLLMPDGSGLSRKIRESDQARTQDMRNVALAHVTGTWRDTFHAVQQMVSDGAQAIVTLGGDGTNRIVAKACAEVPLIPISTGTNNVFPQMIEGTLAGLAAGRIANLGDGAKSLCTRFPKLEIIDSHGALIDLALVDIAVVRSGIRGALAIWKVKDIHSALVTRARSDVIGLSAIAGAIAPNGQAVQVVLGKGGRKVRVAIAPGIVPIVEIASVQHLAEGISVPLGPPGAMLALDGERELRLDANRPLFARLSKNGPWVVDVAAALSDAAGKDTDMKTQSKEIRHGT